MNAEIKEKMKPEVIRTILQDGVDFEVSMNRPKWFKALHLPTSRKFIIYPIRLGPLFRISQLILGMEGINLEEQSSFDYFSTGLNSIIKNKDRMVEIAAIGIMNCKVISPYQRARKWLLMRFLNANLDAHELLEIIGLVIAQMDVTDFLASIVSIKRINLVVAEKKAAS